MKAFLVIVCCLFTVSATAAEMKWSGGATIRHLRKKSDDGLGTKDATTGADSSVSYERRHEAKVNLALQSTGEVIDWVVGIRTQASGVSEWFTYNDALDRAVSLEQAAVRYKLGLSSWGNSAFLLGRQKTVIAYDAVAQTLFDNDVRLNGLSFTWSNGNFGFNTAHYVLGANNAGTAPSSSAYTKSDATEAVASTKSSFAGVTSLQPTFRHSFNDEISALFAVGYHIWQSRGFWTNAIHGGVAGSAGNVNPVLVDNARQWQFLSTVNLPYSLVFIGEYIRNKKQFYGTLANMTAEEADRDAYALSLNYGKIKKAWDYNIGYTYSEKGIASVVGRFTNGDFLPDNKGHMLRAKLAVTEALSLGFGAFYLKEKALLDGSGTALTGANANRKQTSSRYDFLATVSF